MSDTTRVLPKIAILTMENKDRGQGRPFNHVKQRWLPMATMGHGKSEPYGPWTMYS